jgi:hypothetical protein
MLGFFGDIAEIGSLGAFVAFIMLFAKAVTG